MVLPFLVGSKYAMQDSDFIRSKYAMQDSDFI